MLATISWAMVSGLGDFFDHGFTKADTLSAGKSIAKSSSRGGSADGIMRRMKAYVAGHCSASETGSRIAAAKDSQNRSASFVFA